MSSTDRQSRTLVNQDWKTIYQSFRNADFQSYDFDNLRRTMINYLRQNYPEDFNDYIESSEYLALIDLIAFLGQNLSFRVDLNARENFLETAERRESVLRLARLISYNARRNQCANGLLKIDTVSTTEAVIDSRGGNLSGATIRWNDRSNSNYFEQFIKVLNAALPVNNTIGRPLKNETISSISTEQYRFNSLNTDIPIFNFTKTVEGVTTRFEIVSTGIQNGNIVEEPPLSGNSPSFLYRDDGRGAGSTNTGFFMHFRQGRLESSDFSVTNPVPNQVISLDTENINDTDVWLYSVDSNGFESRLWERIQSVEGNNIIYNSLFNSLRNLYAINTRISDRINLIFSDGVFGELPSGNFRVYYRTSDNRRSVINPNALSNILIQIPYISRNNTTETITLGLSLKNTVTNASPSETNEEIKTNAPRTYYTQNRLITAEDYNIGPLAISQDIVKTKSVNRISSGISRYYDISDPTGKYSKTSLFANDGVIYKQEYTSKMDFKFRTQSDIEGIIYNMVEPAISSMDMRNFYYSNYENVFVDNLELTWMPVTSATNRYTGKLVNSSGTPSPIGSFTSNNLKFLVQNSMCRFVPPQTTAGEPQYFLPDGTLTTDKNQPGAVAYKWTKMVSFQNDGTQNDQDGFGPIVFNENIVSGSQIDQIIPVFSRSIDNDLKVRIINTAFVYKDFAISYDRTNLRWNFIAAEDINTKGEFSLGKQGDQSGENQDASWLMYFKTDGSRYTVTYRGMRYVFESADEVRFFFDNSDKIYDPRSGETIKDKIEILSVNTRPEDGLSFTTSFDWSITDEYKDKDGYVNTSKIQIDFFDRDDDGVVDDPELFDTIVNEKLLDNTRKYIIQKKYITSNGTEDFRYFSNQNQEVLVVPNDINWTQYAEGQVLYIVSDNVFKIVKKSINQLVYTSDYRAFVGRSGLKFHYLHVSDSNYRVDPASSNIIDTYLLTRTYDLEFRNYINGNTATRPLPPSSDTLFRRYGSQINSIKSISDEVVYHPVKYKPLFGTQAADDLQVTFKIVKNKNLTINSNELKADIIDNINRFFSIEYWDFGDTFYFQELSAYIMNSLSPELVSIIIVPKSESSDFGSLFEIKSQPDEIFINAATVDDIEIIDEITATALKSQGRIINSVDNVNTGIQSLPSGV